MSTKKANADKPRRPDWEAIERSFATGRYTDGELATLHGVSREAICRRRKREQAADPRRWRRDLTDQVRVATQALLLQKEVTETITAGHTATAVLAAAEIGKQVILSHRTELRDAKSVAAGLLRELKESALLAEHVDDLAKVLAGESPEDIGRARMAVQRALGLGSRVSSIKALAEALTKLHAAERVAFDLEDYEQAGKAAANTLAALVGQMKGSAIGVVKDVPPEEAL